mmetsp:Transcript_41842/g.65384  ORF Transcript_41842/g.65384 Transcript_41842/m.65384 type:complete len:163 (+) Transcript_41842:228-716(+)
MELRDPANSHPEKAPGQILGSIIGKLQEYKKLALNRESHIKELESKFEQMTATCKGYVLALERINLSQEPEAAKLAFELEVDHWKARCGALQSELEEEREGGKREKEAVAESHATSVGAWQSKAERLQQENSLLLELAAVLKTLSPTHPKPQRLAPSNYGVP